MRKKSGSPEGEPVALLFFSAAAAAAGAVAGAAAAAGAADTLSAAFLSLIHIAGSQAQDQCQHRYNNNIYQTHSLLLSAESIFSIDLSVSADTQEYQHGRICHNENQAARKACAQNPHDDRVGDP